MLKSTSRPVQFNYSPLCVALKYLPLEIHGVQQAPAATDHYLQEATGVSKLQDTLHLDRMYIFETLSGL